MSDIAFKVLIGNGYDDVLFKTIMLKGEKGDQGEAGGALIDDTTTSTEKTWSSSKINSEISAKPSAFSQLNDVAITNISDGQMPVYDFTTGKWKNQNVDASTLKYNSVKTIKDELDAKASSLTDLDDVNITNPQNDQGMIYDSTTGKWKNGNPAVSGDLDDLDDVQINLNTLANGQVLKWDAQNNKWVNGNGSSASALADLSDVDLDSTIPDSSSLVYNATEGKWENKQLDATNLPIESGSATNTKDYIDSGLSGKVQIAIFSFNKTISASSEATYFITRTDFNLPNNAVCISAFLREGTSSNVNAGSLVYSAYVNPTTTNAVEGKMYNGTTASRTYNITATIFYTI